MTLMSGVSASVAISPRYAERTISFKAQPSSPDGLIIQRPFPKIKKSLKLGNSRGSYCLFSCHFSCHTTTPLWSMYISLPSFSTGIRLNGLFNIIPEVDFPAFFIDIPAPVSHPDKGQPVFIFGIVTVSVWFQFGDDPSCKIHITVLMIPPHIVDTGGVCGKQAEAVFIRGGYSLTRFS